MIHLWDTSLTLWVKMSGVFQKKTWLFGVLQFTEETGVLQNVRTCLPAFDVPPFHLSYVLTYVLNSRAQSEVGRRHTMFVADVDRFSIGPGIGSGKWWQRLGVWMTTPLYLLRLTDY